MRLADLAIVRTVQLAAIGWALVLPLSALAGAHGGPAGTNVIPGAVYGLGAVVCHQRAERSFATGGRPWPVCARCSGLYAGAALAALLGLAQRRRTAARATSSRRARWLLTAAVMPSLGTLAFEWITGAAPGNPVRFAAGLPIGLCVMSVIAAAARPVHPSGSVR